MTRKFNDHRKTRKVYPLKYQNTLIEYYGYLIVRNFQPLLYL
jgi:hypothetical protein